MTVIISLLIALCCCMTSFAADPDQSRDTLDGSRTVWQEISDGLDIMTVGGRTIHRVRVGRFASHAAAADAARRLATSGYATLVVRE